jgi:uncharacterized membrane protein
VVVAVVGAIFFTAITAFKTTVAFTKRCFNGTFFDGTGTFNFLWIDGEQRFR